MKDCTNHFKTTMCVLSMFEAKDEFLLLGVLSSLGGMDKFVQVLFALINCILANFLDMRLRLAKPNSDSFWWGEGMEPGPQEVLDKLQSTLEIPFCL